MGSDANKYLFADAVVDMTRSWNTLKAKHWMTSEIPSFENGKKPNPRLLKAISELHKKVTCYDWQDFAETFGKAIKLWARNLRGDDNFQWSLLTALPSEPLYHYYMEAHRLLNKQALNLPKPFEVGQVVKAKGCDYTITDLHPHHIALTSIGSFRTTVTTTDQELRAWMEEK
jgi:hypothetical protein